jgi:hypothetical protein
MAKEVNAKAQRRKGAERAPQREDLPNRPFTVQQCGKQRLYCALVTSHIRLAEGNRRLFSH